MTPEEARRQHQQTIDALQQFHEMSPAELHALVEAVHQAEEKAYSDWWCGGRTDVPDHYRQDEMNRRRRVAIVRAIVASFGWR